MTKADLIDRMAANANISRVAAAKALESFIGGIGDALTKGEKVALVGFGSFSVTQRKERKGRNPRTGEEVTIKASRKLKFTAGSALKEKVK